MINNYITETLNLVFRWFKETKKEKYDYTDLEINKRINDILKK